MNVYNYVLFIRCKQIILVNRMNEWFIDFIDFCSASRFIVRWFRWQIYRKLMFIVRWFLLTNNSKASVHWEWDSTEQPFLYCPACILSATIRSRSLYFFNYEKRIVQFLENIFFQNFSIDGFASICETSSIKIHNLIGPLSKQKIKQSKP